MNVGVAGITLWLEQELFSGDGDTVALVGKDSNNILLLQTQWGQRFRIEVTALEPAGGAPALEQAPLEYLGATELLDLLRDNHRLLTELGLRFGVGRQTGGEGRVLSPAVSSPDDVARLLLPEMGALVQEQVRVLLLDTQNRVVGQQVIYQGNVQGSLMRPAEVLRPAVIEGCPRIILVHNHPSGDAAPSPEDLHVTRVMLQAAELLGVEILDHIIVGREGTVSIREDGLVDWSQFGEGGNYDRHG